ncbi:PAS domain S-box protein [Gemmatimonadota bacterium]
MTLTNKQQKKSRNHILAVDDYPDNLLVLRKLIGKYLPDCEVMTATGAREGLEMVAERPFDVILLDVQMPEMDGIEMCRRLKSDERTAHIPIILMTAYMITPEQKAEGLNAGADDFITKPIENVELTAKINVMLRIKSAEDDLRETNIHLEDLVDERTQALRESEEKYRLLFDNMLDGFAYHEILLDKNGQPVDYRFLEVNSTFERLTGLKRDEVIGKKVTEVLPGIREDEFDWIGVYGKVALTGEGTTFENYSEPFGKWFTVSVMSNRERCFATIFSDITERKRTEEKLRESEQKHRDLYNNAVVAIMRSSLEDGRILAANDYAVRLFGYSSREEFISEFRFRESYVDPDDRKRLSDELKLKGRLDNCPVRHKRKDGTIIWVEISTRMYPQEGYIEGAAVDITERKQAEEALRESEDRLSSFMNSASDSFYLLDSDLNFVEINERGLEIIGKDKEEVIGKNITEIVPDVRESGRYDEHLKVLNTGNPFVIEDFVPHPKFGDLHFVLKSFKSGDGVGVIASDITDLKQAEERLRYFQKAVDGATDAIGMSTPEGRHYYQNQAMTELFGGMTTEEVDGESGPPSTIYADEAVGREVFETIMKGETWNGEVKMVGKDGRELDIFLRAYSIKDEKGKVIGLVGVHNDITERKRTEDIMRLQRDLSLSLSTAPGFGETLKLCFDTAMRISGMDCGGIYLVDETSGDLDLVFHTGLSSGFINSVSHYAADSENARLIMEGKPIYTEHLRIVESTGTAEKCELLHAIAVIPVPYEKEIIACINIASHTLYKVPEYSRTGLETITIQIGNVIARVKAQEALRESEKKYRTLTENINVGIYRNTPGPKGKFIEANPALIEMFDFESRDEFLSIDVSELYQDQGERGRFNKKMLREGSVRNEEIYLKKRDDTPIICSVTADAIRDEKGKIIFYDGIIENITERKQAEEEVRKERDRAQNYLDLAGVMFVAINTAGEVTLINKKGCEMLGYAEGEILGKNWFENFVPERIREEILPVSKKLLNGEIKTAEYYENPILNKRGEERLIAWHNSTVKDDQGNIIAHLSSGEDITERKRAEEAVSLERDRAQKYLDVAGVMLIALDAHGKVSLINHKGCEILGCKEKDIIGKHWFDNFLPQRNRKDVKKAFERLIAGDVENVGYFENPVVNCSGEERILAWHNVLLYDESGGITGTLSSGEDITERKQAEEALRRTRFSVDRAFDSIYWINSEGRFLDVNDAACRELGFSKEELLTKSIKDIVSGYSEDYETEIWPERWKAVKERGSVTFESKHRRKDGNEYPVDISTSIVEFGGKEFMCAFSRDITERKQAEEAINTLVTSTMGSIGQDFFDRIVKSVCEWLGTECAIIGQIMEDKTVNALSMYVDGEFIEDYSYLLEGTPCYMAVEQGFSVYPEGVRELFPDAKDLLELRAEGYVGTVLKNKNENAIGILCALSRSKLNLPRRTEEVMSIIAAKASAEIERLSVEEALRHSEEKFRELAELLPEFVFEMDEQGVLTFMNHQSFDKSGYTHEDFDKGIKGLNLLVPADRKRAGRNLNKVMKGKAPVHNEYTARRKDGSEFPVIVHSTRIMHEGRPAGLRGIMFDITEQKRAEEALRNEQSMLKIRLEHERLLAEVASRLNMAESFQTIMGELMENIGKAMEVDNAGFFRFDENREAVERLSIWSSDTGEQKSEYPQTIPLSKASSLFKKLKENEVVKLSDVSVSGTEENYLFLAGNVKSVLLCPLAIGGQVKGFICFSYSHEHAWNPEEINIFRTITAMIAGAWERDSHFQARLEAERKQTEAIQMAEKTARLASLGTLAAGIAHEINQPLTALKIEVDGTMIRLEQNKQISLDENVETLNFVSSQASRIDEIVSHMRALARQETEEKPTSLNLNKVIRKALSLVDEQVYSHGIELKIETDKSLPLLESHGTLLEQVMINLVVNAMHALNAYESGDKSITVSTSYSEGNAVLTVRDNGPGIEPEHLDHIFDPFFTTKTKSVGMGLGLSITENLVTGLGGTISVANHEQGGAIFTVSLPVSTSNQ